MTSSLGEFIAAECCRLHCVSVGSSFRVSKSERSVRQVAGEPISVVWSSLPISSPTFLEVIGKEVGRIAEQSTAQYIVGVAVSGVPIATCASLASGIPLLIARTSFKDHGRLEPLEGQYVSDVRAMVVENFLNTAQTSLQVIDFVERRGIQVVKVFAVEFGDFLPLQSELAIYDFGYFVTLREKLRMMNDRGYFPGRIYEYICDYLQDPDGYYMGSEKQLRLHSELMKAPDLDYIIKDDNIEVGP